jgi:hypothetical protein
MRENDDVFFGSLNSTLSLARHRHRQQHKAKKEENLLFKSTRKKKHPSVSI